MILTTLVAAVALGIAAQVLAERFQVAAILPLLVFGILFGPTGLALFDPHALGEVLEVLIHLGVAIILFEGGLSLDPNKLLKVGQPVLLLLTVGVAVTGFGCALLAHLLVAMTWPTAVLFGAIMTVTGPTVIVPLLRHMVAPRQAKIVLLSEGLIIDPIGAVLAYFALQWAGHPELPWRQMSAEMVTLAATGATLGFVSGALAKLVVRSRLVAGELRNLSILALLMLCYLIAEKHAPQSGILAAVIMGFTMSAAELPDLVSVKAFKGQLTTLVISSLFILLAGQLKIDTVAALGMGGVLVVVGMMLVIRPLAVALSIPPQQIPWRQRTMIALIAPRGIVAAAVASLAARKMGMLGLPGGPELEGLVYLAILITGAWSTAMALVLPRVLGFVTDPSRRRAVLVGANRLTEELAVLLADNGRTTLVVDAVSWRLDRARAAGMGTVCGDARDAATYEEAGVERDSLIVTATTNDELNLLVAELVNAEFGVEHPVVALQRPPEEFGRKSRAFMDLMGNRSLDVPRWIRLLENSGAELVRIDELTEKSLAVLKQAEREHPESIVRLLVETDGQLSFDVSEPTLESADAVIVLLAHGRAQELLSQQIADKTSSEVVAAS